jgi:hypothetical protein
MFLPNIRGPAPAAPYGILYPMFLFWALGIEQGISSHWRRKKGVYPVHCRIRKRGRIRKDINIQQNTFGASSGN